MELKERYPKFYLNKEYKILATVWKKIFPSSFTFIHLPNFDPKLDPYIYQKSTKIPDFETFLPNLC